MGGGVRRGTVGYGGGRSDAVRHAFEFVSSASQHALSLVMAFTFPVIV